MLANVVAEEEAREQKPEKDKPSPFMYNITTNVNKAMDYRAGE